MIYREYIADIKTVTIRKVPNPFLTMKLRLPLLLAAAVMATYSPVSLAADPSQSNGFSINFYSSGGATLSGDDLVGMPGVETAAKYWNNVSPTEANKTYDVTLNNLGQALSGITVKSTRVVNDWHPGQTTSQTDKLLSSYIDASSSDVYTVTIAGVPYLSSTLYVIMSGDGGTFTAMNVNGTNWSYDKDTGKMVEGASNNWGNRAKDQAALTLGTNVLQIDHVTGGLINITNVKNGSGRGTIAGLQVIDTYTGTYMYRTLTAGTAKWNDSLWSNTSGGTGDLAWGGTAHGAVITADAGGSTLTLDGTVTADGLILQSGKLILSGGTLNMTGPASLITTAGSTLKLDGTAVTSTGSVILSGEGIYEIENLALLPKTWNMTGGSLSSTKDITVPSESKVTLGETVVVAAPSVTIDSKASVAVTGILLASFKDSSIAGTGEIILSQGQGYTKDNLPALHSLLQNFNGTLTLSGNIEYYFNYSGGTMDSNLTLGKENMTIHVAKGATFKINHISAGSNTFGNKFIFDAGSTFFKQDGSPLILSGDILLNGNDTDAISIIGYWGGPKETRFTGKISGQGKVRILDTWASENFSLYNADNDFSGVFQIGTEGSKTIKLNLQADASSKASIEIGGGGVLGINTTNASIVDLQGSSATAQLTSGAAGNTLSIQSGNYAGIIGANLNLNKTGTGSLSLSGDMSASNGTMTVTSGTLNLTNYTGSGAFIVNGGNLSLSGTGSLIQGSTIADGATLSFLDGVYKLYMTADKSFNAGTIEIKDNAVFRTTSKWKYHLTLDAGSTLKGGGTLRFDVPEVASQTDGYRRLFINGNTANFSGTIELYASAYAADNTAYRTQLTLNSADSVFGGVIKTVGITKPGDSDGDKSVVDENVIPAPALVIVQKNMAIGGFEGKGGQLTTDQTAGVDLTIGNSASHSFGGSIGANLDIIKVGAGTQVFNGDMAAFNGTLEARSGILDLSSSKNLGKLATSFKLAGGKLKLGDFNFTNQSTLNTSTVSAGSVEGNLTLSGGTVTVLNDTSAVQYVINGNLSLGTGSGAKLVLDLSALTSLEASSQTYLFKLFQTNNAPLTLTWNDVETKGLLIDDTSRDSLVFGQDTSSGNVITMAFTKAEVVTLTWNGNGSLWETKKDASSWTADIASADSSFHTGDIIVFTANGAQKNVTITGAVKPQKMSVTGGDYVFTAGTNGSITGDSTLTMSGGSLSMNLANTTWTGNIDITNSELKFVENGLGTGTITLKEQATLTWLDGNAQDISSRLKWSEDTHLSLGVNGSANEVTLGTTVGTKANITKTGAGTLTLNGAGRLSGTITVGTVDLAGGTLKLAGGGSAGGAFKGAISVINGVLLMSAVDVTGWSTTQTSNTSGIRVEENGQLQIDARQTFSNLLITLKGGTITGSASADLFGNGTSIVTEASSKQAVISTLLGLRQNDTVFNVADGEAAVDLLISGSIKNNIDANAAGNHNLVKQGAGYLKISGAYLATGTVTVQQGTLEFNNDSLTATGLSVADGAMILMNGSSVTGLSYGGTLSGYNNNAGIVAVASNNKLTLSGNSAAYNGTLQLLEDSTLTLQGNIGAADLRGSGALIVNGGEAVISGGNDGASLFSGSVTITNGMLRAGTDTALGTNDIALNGGTLDVVNERTLANKIIASGGTVSGAGNASIGDVVAHKAFSMTGTLSAASLSVDSNVRVSAANLTVRGNLSLGNGAHLSTSGNLTLAGGSSLILNSLNLTRDDASIDVVGSFALTGNSPVSIRLGDDFMSNQISEGNYTILSATGGLSLDNFTAGNTLGGKLWEEISDVYKFELTLSDDNTRLFLHATIDNNKAWQWNGGSSGTWSNDSALEWKDKNVGPEGKAVFFGAESPQDQLVTINEAGVNPLFLQIQSNSTYIFEGGAISDYVSDTNAKPTSLMMAGTGTAIFRNANTFTGNITLTKGTLVMENADALGQGGDIIFNEGTLEFGAGSSDVSSRFVVNSGKDLKLAVSQHVDIELSNLSDELTESTALLLEKSGAGNLSLSQDFAGSIHITDASTEEAGIRVRRTDSGGTLTLLGAAYNAIEVDELNTLIIDGQVNDTVTLASTTQGSGTIQVQDGKTLTYSAAGTFATKLNLKDASTLNLAAGVNALNGGITVEAIENAAVINANTSTVSLGGNISGASTLVRNGVQPSQLMLTNGIFNLSGASVKDNVHLTLGQGTDTATIDLDADEETSLRIANLTTNQGSVITGIDGQTLELVNADLAGNLQGEFTVQISANGNMPGASVLLQETFTAESGISFHVAGGVLDLGGLALSNAITITSGSLANASHWDGGSEITVDTSAKAAAIDLGELQASALVHVTSSAGTSIDNIGHGRVTLATANLTLDSPNTLTYIQANDSMSGEGKTILNFGKDGQPIGGDTIALQDGVNMRISLGDELKDEVLKNFSIDFDKDELLPDYADPSDKANSLHFTITNGTLDFDLSRVEFDPLLRIWGLKIEAVEGGSVIVNGNLSVWRASVEGNITSYDDLFEYRAVYVNADMRITLPGSDETPLVIKYLSGQKGSSLIIDSDGTGIARVQFYNDRDKDGELVNSTLAGNLTASVDSALSKAGEATLTIGGSVSIMGSLSIEEGGIALSKASGIHGITSLSIGQGGKAAAFTLSGKGATVDVENLALGNNGSLILSGNKSGMAVNNLNDASGSILLGGNSTLKLSQGGNISGTIHAMGDKAGTGTLELGSGTTTLTNQNALNGINLSTDVNTILVLDNPDMNASIVNWNGDGALVGDGSLSVTGVASHTGSFADFYGSLAAVGNKASFTIASTGNRNVALTSSQGASLVLDYSSGDAAYGSLSVTGGSSVTLMAGNGNGMNNTLTLRQGGSISGDSTLGFVLNTEANGSLSSTKPLITTGGKETLNIASGATISLSAGAGQETIYGTMPFQIALASKVNQEGNIEVTFDELFGKYFDPTQSYVHTIDGTMILTTAANTKGFYIHHAQSDVSRAGGALMDNALVTINPQTTDKDSTLSALLSSVDASIKAHDTAGASRTMAAAAGSTVTSLLGSQQADYRYQQTLLRNRMTTMGLPTGYSYEGDLPLWNTWMQATGTYNRLNTDGDAAGYQYNTWGGTFGADANLSPKFTAGIALSASYGKLTSEGADSLCGDTDTYYVNLFGRYQSGKWGHNFILTTGWNQGTVDRTVPLGLNSYAGHSETSGSTWGAMYEATYDIKLNEENSSILQPLVNIAVSKTSIDDYSEAGAGNAGLNVSDLDATTATISAGVRWMSLMGGNLFGRESLAELRMQVTQELGDTENEARVGFQGTPGFTQQVKGSKAGTTGLQFGAGVTIPSGEQGSIFMEANADIRSRMTSANGSIGYRYNF